jgi:uncharacterized protein
MRGALGSPPPWYVAGPVLGLLVVGMAAAFNDRLGVIGAYSELVGRARGRAARVGWKPFFLLGIVAGGALFGLLAGAWRVGEGYGWLSRAAGDDDAFVVAPVLLAAGALIGYGAKMAGGCTSGNGLSGCATGSPASFAATMTFMATAIAVAFVTRWVFVA